MDFKKLPKIELHCHLDGSIRPSTIIDLAKKEGLEIPSTEISEIIDYVKAPESCKSLDEYLERFQLPIQVMQSKENLKRVAFELMEDSALDNVKYIEIRFAPTLHTNKGLTLEEIIQSVLEGMKKAESKYNIHGNLILSCMRHLGAESASKTIDAGRNFLGKGVVAVDLAGGENRDFAKEYIEEFKKAKDYGYRITIHAGETAIGENVKDAIELLSAERIGHGIYSRQCREAYELVKKLGITLEMCPTSNVQTKAVNKYEDHPLRNYFNEGIKVTINTDNMTVSDTSMSKEVEVMTKVQKLSEEELKTIYLNSVEASFASEDIKSKLRNYIL